MFLRTFSTTLLVLLLAFPVQAAELRWTGENTFMMDGLDLARPSVRWRVAPLPEPEIVRITYPKGGRNPEFRIARKQPLPRKTTRGKGKKRDARMQEALLNDAFAAGFTLVDFAAHRCFITAKLTRQDRGLWMSFFFSNPAFTSDIIVVKGDMTPTDAIRLSHALKAVEAPVLASLPASCEEGPR